MKHTVAKNAGELPTIGGKRMLSRAAAAKRYGCGAERLTQAMEVGALPVAEMRGSVHMFWVEDLENYFGKGEAA